MFFIDNQYEIEKISMCEKAIDYVKFSFSIITIYLIKILSLIIHLRQVSQYIELHLSFKVNQKLI